MAGSGSSDGGTGLCLCTTSADVCPAPDYRGRDFWVTADDESAQRIGPDLSCPGWWRADCDLRQHVRHARGRRSHEKRRAQRRQPDCTWPIEQQLPILTGDGTSHPRGRATGQKFETRASAQQLFQVTGSRCDSSYFARCAGVWSGLFSADQQHRKNIFWPSGDDLQVSRGIDRPHQLAVASGRDGFRRGTGRFK